MDMNGTRHRVVWRTFAAVQRKMSVEIQEWNLFQIIFYAGFKLIALHFNPLKHRGRYTLHVLEHQQNLNVVHTVGLYFI
jgi:hypothetical protein